MTAKNAKPGFLEENVEDQPALAAMIMVGSLFLLGFQDALVKLVSSELSLWQFQMLRAGINFVLLLALMHVVWCVKANPWPKHIKVPRRVGWCRSTTPI